MRNKPDPMSKGAQGLQNNPDFVIMNNPLANPKFVRKISKTETKAISVKEVYAPKLFYEVASRLRPEDLENLKDTDTIAIEVNVRSFAKAIGAISNKNIYADLKITAEHLADLKISFKDKNGLDTYVGIFTKVKTDEKGKLILYVDSELAEKIVDVKEKENFSFLKQHIFDLKNGQSIKLYPFFKSWLNNGRYETDLERFKVQFGYDTDGYKKYSNFELKVLKSAIEEINEKTDIIIKYQPTGENLEGKRPRVTGLIFRISAKEKVKALIGETIHTKLTAKEQEELEQEQAPKNEPVQAINNNAQLHDLFKRINVVNKPDDITASVLVDSWVLSLGYEVVEDGFLGMIATKAKAETVAFFTPDNLKKYTGYKKKLQDQEQQKQQKQQEQRSQQEKRELIEKIKKSYARDKTLHYEKKYNELTEEARQAYIDEIWESNKVKSVYFKNGDKKQPNSFAIELIGQKLTFPNGYDEQATIKAYTFKTYGIQVDFDAQGQMILA